MLALRPRADPPVGEQVRLTSCGVGEEPACPGQPPSTFVFTPIGAKRSRRAPCTAVIAPILRSRFAGRRAPALFSACDTPFPASGRARASSERSWQGPSWRRLPHRSASAGSARTRELGLRLRYRLLHVAGRLGRSPAVARSSTCRAHGRGRPSPSPRFRNSQRSRPPPADNSHQGPHHHPADRAATPARDHRYPKRVKRTPTFPRERVTDNTIHPDRRCTGHRPVKRPRAVTLTRLLHDLG